jgi:SAM-dependent methyltransferase
MDTLVLRRVKKKMKRLLGLRQEPEDMPRWNPIWPRIPPLDAYSTVGDQTHYFIHQDYQARIEPEFFDDTQWKDEWQKEVYQFAREVAEQFGWRRVLDIGCGSGFKLMRYFRDVETLGLDLEPTVHFLRTQYPERRWEVCDFRQPPDFQPELVICADVIEHLPQPECLVRFIQMLEPRHVVISTPERNLLMQGTHNGPPKNPAHVREWSFAEFRAYMESEFEVLVHFVSNAVQATQCVLAKPQGRQM